MKFSSSLFIILMLLTSLIAQDKNKTIDESSTYNGLKFRCVGPALTSGRIVDFAVNPDNPAHYYTAVASGGVWKTTNAGTTWEPVFDNEGSYSIGCVTMDPNNPHVVWVGTGENNSQRSVGYGDGVYKSTDGGKSWKHMGLKNSEHIAKIIVHPENSNVIYAASQGPLWNAGGDRGLFKSEDGGKTWENILSISKHTGISDLVYDSRNPDVMYASAYQRRRHVFTLINGGPESAIYKTEDGGKNWRKLESGLPSSYMGRIGLAISPVNPDYVYAIVEAAEDKEGFYRSTDRGESWEKMSDYICSSPQYYQEIVCDPVDVDRLIVLDTYSKYTDDGGKTFHSLNNSGRHVDDHAFWVDPKNPSHYIIGGDGGIYESFDRAANWRFVKNLPVTQFYKVEVDNAEPFYNIYGGTQDNQTLGGPSQTLDRSGIHNYDWYVTKGGDGFETQIDPVDPNIVYSQSQYGWLARYDKKSGEKIGIRPQEDKGEEPYRWNWDAALLISPHKHTRLYFAANYLFKSEDRGNTWEKVSPDLTRQIDRNKLEVMGRVWGVDTPSKNASTSFYGNIVALSESPLQEGLLYVGTDDGLVQVSEDGGANWRKIESFPTVPDTTYVNFLLASNHDVNTVYAAFNNHKRGDFKPYILKSTDRGKTWNAITNNLPERGSVYGIAEDDEKQGLLFAGTEFGVFFSLNDGENWVQLKSGLPTIAIRDIDIQERENDVVLGSFGRGFYVLDDYTPLRQVTEEVLNKDAHVFEIEDALWYQQSSDIGGSGKASQGEDFFVAPNPPFGATFTYYLKDDMKTLTEQRREKESELVKNDKPVPFPNHNELRAEDDEEKPYLLFTISDSDGKVVRRLKTKPSKGINRITWDLAYAEATPLNPGDFYKIDDGSSLVLPGTYTVEMAKSVNGNITTLTEPVSFNVVPLDNSTFPATDKAAMTAFQSDLEDLRGKVYGAINLAENTQDKLARIKLALKAGGAPSDMIEKTRGYEQEVKDILRKLEGDRTLSSRNINQAPSIADRLDMVAWEQSQSTSAPTETFKKAYSIAKEEFEVVLKDLSTLVEVNIDNLEEQMDKMGLPWTPGRVPELN